jgi:hypothetical protein
MPMQYQSDFHENSSNGYEPQNTHAGIQLLPSIPSSTESPSDTAPRIDGSEPLWFHTWRNDLTYQLPVANMDSPLGLPPPPEREPPVMAPDDTDHSATGGASSQAGCANADLLAGLLPSSTRFSHSSYTIKPRMLTEVNTGNFIVANQQFLSSLRDPTPPPPSQPAQVAGQNHGHQYGGGANLQVRSRRESSLPPLMNDTTSPLWRKNKREKGVRKPLS